MVGGLAVGVLGSMLFTEMMDGFDVEEMFEVATEDLDGGFDSFFDSGDGILSQAIRSSWCYPKIIRLFF
ncbi:hypothetical protein [Bacillus sp. SD075]|uniref:hypothetical protein n=1 Tax=Bacillus sp. SD075 TaxID=2781732 RepID=UPI001A9691A8|nr:hypothetical protein [Bacillus sp. SD075]